MSRNRDELSPDETQAGMTMIAASDLKIAEAVLDKEINRLRQRLNDEDAEKRLDAAQSAWKKFVAKEADIRAWPYNGGTMAPTMRAGEMHHMTVERTAQIREQIELIDIL